MRKESVKPVEVASFDQLVMSKPGIVLQAEGKLTNKGFSGSKVCAGHDSSTKHIAHLEHFTVDSTIASNEEIERHKKKVNPW